MRCDQCGKDALSNHLLKQSGLSREAQGWTFGNTKRTSVNADAYDTAKLLSTNPARFYTLLSPTVYGVGKTRLLACLVNAVRALGEVAIYTTTADVMDYLRAGYNPTNVEVMTYDVRFDLLKNCRLLCLDEFDRWQTSEWAMEKFVQLTNWRYERAADLMTAFAANATLTDLPGYVASRMQDRKNHVYLLDGVDVRRLERE